MLCKKCVKEILDGSLFCNFCGARQQAAARNTKKRGNGQGTVYKMPSGSWAAEVTLGYYLADGKKHRKKARNYGFKTKKDALAHVETLRNSPINPEKTTISEYWARLETETDNFSESRKSAYKIAWNKIKNNVGYRTIQSFSAAELQEITDEAANSFYTRRDIKNLFSKFYEMAMRDELVSLNKSKFIKLPQKLESERAVFTPAEIQALWADYNTEPCKITAQMLVMLYTGIRPGELMSIQLENVRLTEHYMTGGIKTEKGKRRKIIIPDKLMPVMEYLIGTARKGQLAYYSNPDQFYDLWKEKRAALNLNTELKPYCCRHTYITNLTALKVSPAMLQELAGHEDYDTTLEYTHLSVADRLAEVNRLE